MLLCLTFVGALLSLPAIGLAGETDATPRLKPTQGLLRVHPDSPRWFTDGTRNANGCLTAIYLGGHQIFVDLQDNSFNKEWTKDMNRPEDPGARARLLDWNGYLDFLREQRFNYLRGWIIWSTGSGTAAPPYRVAHPMPFLRTGPGNANDGSPKFDLHRFDDTFFQRLHDRAKGLQERGIYLSVMLFELYGFLDGEAVDGQRLWEGNVVHRMNNVNGLDVDRNQNGLGEEFFSLEDPEILKIQKAYLEKMVDAVNDLDNVFWEICNEGPAASLAWQLEMLRHLKASEARRAKQHLVLLSPGGWAPGGWSLMPEQQFVDSPADCIATAAGWIDQNDPKTYDIKRPVFMDLDHVAPGSSDPALVWRALTRGYHFNLYDQPFEQPQSEARAWQVVRANVRQTRCLAEQVENWDRMVPRDDLSSTRYCLADEGQEYIVYASEQDDIVVKGLRVGEKYRREWFNTAQASREDPGQFISDAPEVVLRPPCPRVVLFLTLDHK